MNNPLLSSVFDDNQACIAMTRNTVNSETVKHFAIKPHFFRVNLCPSKKMTADVLTKAVGMVKFQRFSKEIASDISTQSET